MGLSIYTGFFAAKTDDTFDNVSPTAVLGNGGTVTEGAAGSVDFSGAFDPSTADTTAGFRYAYDFDNDGWQDVVALDRRDGTTGREGRAVLFLNQGDGRFRDASSGSGADHAGYGMGVAAGDYDGDGLVDLYVTNVGPNVLLRNLGDGRFEDVSADAGVDDRQLDPVAVTHHLQGDPAALGRRLEGVADQVGHDLLETLRIGQHRRGAAGEGPGTR